MRRLLIITLTFLCNFAQADIAGEFDYYVLALSWTPNWCAREGDARGSAQCDPDQGFGWTLHGLWPQYERGYPQDCAAPASLDPTRQQSALMADIMGSGGLAFYQWRKHGRCSGLSGSAYYAASRAAYEAVTRPPVLRQLPRALKIPA
ncbi:MAG: ribonuclease T2 family protein, partial [Mangrovicoccus sp.]